MHDATLFLINNPLFNGVGDAAPFVKPDPVERAATAVDSTTSSVAQFVSGLPWLGQLVEGTAQVATDATEDLAVRASLLRRAKNNAIVGGLGIYFLLLFSPSVNKQMAWASGLELGIFHFLPGVLVWMDAPEQAAVASGRESSQSDSFRGRVWPQD